MADNAPIDENSAKGLIGASSADGKTPVKVYANPSTHRLLVEATTGVSGPGSSTDNAIARFDGTSGETIQNSLAILDDTGVINAVGYKAGGTAAVADGTYTVGNSITPVTGALGTITTKGGIITAVQEAT